MSYQHLRLSVSGPIGELTLARPESRNAMTREMGQELVHAVDAVNRESALRVLLVRGQGRGFSAGGDVRMLEERARASEVDNRRVMREFYASFLSIRQVRVPTIAGLHGAVVGAGLCLAMACDVRVAAQSAELSANFVRVGLHPGMGATWLLPTLVGAAKAAELLLLGATVGAPEAHRIGLVHHTVPDDELDAFAQSLATRVAEAAPVAVALTKATLRAATQPSLEAALDREAEAQALTFATHDLQEALSAFAAKRRPGFLGR